MPFGNLANIGSFADNISGKIKGGVSAAASATGIVDANKQKMKPLVAEKAKMYEFIGMEIFDLYVAGKMSLEEIEPFCKKIETLNAEIAAIETEIAANAVKACECGAKITKGVKFCPSCGKSTAADSVPQLQAANVIECVCGAQLEVGALMCMECGRRAG